MGFACHGLRQSARQIHDELQKSPYSGPTEVTLAFKIGSGCIRVEVRAGGERSDPFDWEDTMALEVVRVKQKIGSISTGQWFNIKEFTPYTDTLWQVVYDQAG